MGRFAVLGAALSLFASISAQAATYPPSFFLLNTHIGYESVNPTDLNARVSNLANINGLIAARVRAERGLIYPDWSHWIEVGFFMNQAATRDLVGSVDSDLQQSLWFLSVIPLGGTWWFFKTAFVDFGASFGIGAALAMNYSSSITQVSTGTVTSSGTFTSPFAPLVDSKLQVRLWFAKYWAIDGAFGMRFLSTNLKDASNTSVTANLLSVSVLVGATYAFGGYKGVGRTYSEVLQAGATQRLAPQPVTPAFPDTMKDPVRPTQPSMQQPAVKSPVRRGAVR